MKRKKRILVLLGRMVLPLNKLAPHDTLIRCKKALRVWEKGKYDFIITTGGIFSAPRCPDHTNSRINETVVFV